MIFRLIHPCFLLFIIDYAFSVHKHGVYRRPWYTEVDMTAGTMTWPLFNSLQCFYPGLLSQYTLDTLPLRETVMAFHSIWRKYGCIAEGFNLLGGYVQPGQKGYPLRPELAETIYLLYRATRDPMYLYMGRDIIKSLNFVSKVVNILIYSVCVCVAY